MFDLSKASNVGYDGTQSENGMNGNYNEASNQNNNYMLQALNEL